MSEPETPRADIPPNVQQFLRSRPIATVATASPSGVPHATTLIYAYDERDLYVWLRSGSVTAHHIDTNPAVAFTVDEYSDDWTKIKGVQASGEAHLLRDPDEIQRVIGIFKEKFADVAVDDTADLSFFRVVPQQVHFIDNASHAGTERPHAVGQDFHRALIYSVFRDLPTAHVEAVAARMEAVSFDEGQIIVSQGEPADTFFIMVDGEVEVVREVNGRTDRLRRLGPGEFFGEVAILREVPRTATVRALRPTTLLTMDRDTFRSLIAQSLSTTADIDEIIRQRLEPDVAD